MTDDRMSFRRIMRQPSASAPVAMSLMALATVALQIGMALAALAPVFVLGF